MMDCTDKINEGETVIVDMIGAHPFMLGDRVVVVKDCGGFFKCTKGNIEGTLLDIEIKKRKWKK